MSAKTRINSALSRLTGHHLVKGEPGGYLNDVLNELEKTRRELEQSRRQGGAPQRGVKPRGDGLPRDYDEAAKTIIRAVRPFTMTSHEKLYGLIEATRYVVRNKIPGDIVECGVWRGGSMQAAARTLLDSGDTSRHLYLFDTFEGMSEPTAVDVRWDGKTASELLETLDRTTYMWAIASLDDVRAGFKNVPYPEDQLHYLVGRVEDTIPDGLPDRIAVLRLDTDFYESTKHELEHAFARLSPGGVLIIDDYAHWAGSKKATDEFTANLDEPFLLHRLGGGRIGVRPFPRST